MAEQKNGLHSLVMENRKRLAISGVKEVEGFTETEVRLYTDMGQITVKGRNLKVNQVSTETGELIMNGDLINSVVYSEKTKRAPNNFITKLFR
ncbi:MAG: sporulation protein YabP [Oscillospiraceae bacterium]|nr:sporulation protein YabP [Oscillospiraceae bacterium]